MKTQSVKVGRTSELAPGELKAFDVNGVKVAVARAGDAWYAFDDTCTHLQCSLADGDLDGTTVTCPCHGSQFDVRTGGVLAPPATVPVKTYGIHVEGEDLQIEV